MKAGLVGWYRKQGYFDLTLIIETATCPKKGSCLVVQSTLLG